MECYPAKGAGPTGPRARLIEIGAIAVAVPFAFGAVLLALRLVHLPDMAGHLMRAQVLGATLLSFGLALGAIGSAFALTSTTPNRRTLCLAITLFGLSHVVFGFYVRHAIEAATLRSTPPVVPFFIPLALWAYSVVLAFRAPKLTPAPASEPSSEEPTPAASEV